MKRILILAVFLLPTCRGPKTSDEISGESRVAYARAMSKIDVGSRGKPHEFDKAGFCVHCNKMDDDCCAAEACPVASKR